jgi:competence protein ComEA
MKKLLFVILTWFAFTGAAFAAVNVNTATKEQLETLNGIGPVKAQAIIDYRTKNGPFKSLEDVDKVPGIGEGTIAKIKSDVTLSGATTVPAKKETAKEEKAPAKKVEEKKAEAKGAAKADEAKAEAGSKKAKKADVAKADDKVAGKKSKKSKTDDTKTDDTKK